MGLSWLSVVAARNRRRMCCVLQNAFTPNSCFYSQSVDLLSGSGSLSGPYSGMAEEQICEELREQGVVADRRMTLKKGATVTPSHV